MEGSGVQVMLLSAGSQQKHHDSAEPRQTFLELVTEACGSSQDWQQENWKAIVSLL